MNAEAQQARPSFAEFVVIISLMMSITALSTDAMLPALPEIGSDLGVQNANERQLVVSVLFLGQALGIALPLGGQASLWLFVGCLMVTFFCVGVLFGNQNSMAMEPLGHLAGMGAAVVGSLSRLISMSLGTIIGQSYNGTLIPLIAGLALLSGLAMLAVRWADSR